VRLRGLQVRQLQLQGVPQGGGAEGQVDGGHHGVSLADSVPWGTFHQEF
jgi:hypothetical protein